MSNSLGDVRFGAVGLALLATGCLSSGEPLFTEDPVFELGPPPAQMPGAGTPARTGENPTSSVAVSPAPEQLFGAGRDVTPPAAGASDPVEPEPLPGTAADEPAAPVDPCGLEGLILCDSFEAAAEGVFPATVPNSLGEGWLPELAGCGSHSVDGAGPSFSGTKALRADDGGYPECMLHADSSGEAEVFVRTRVYLGDGDALIGQYLSLLEFGARPDQDDPELRIGVRPSNDNICATPGLDVTGTGLSTGSRTDCTGFVLEPSRWYCIEGHLTRSEGNLNLTISVDGEEVIARDFVGASVWNGSDLFVKVGRAAYGASGSGTVWHDDVAVGRQPTPCGP
jgi:hypothetical protein